MTRKPQPTKKGKGISLGWASEDDPMYTNAGWNFLMGKNLNPNLNKPTPKPKDEEEQPK